MSLGSTQPLTEISTRNLPRCKERPAFKVDNVTAICEPIVWKNIGASTSHNAMGLHGLLQGYLYLYLRCTLSLGANSMHKNYVMSSNREERTFKMFPDCTFEVKFPTDVSCCKI
jgi:hypothetical protein